MPLCRQSGAKVKSKGSTTKNSFKKQVKTKELEKTRAKTQAKVATLPKVLSARASEIASTGSGGGAAAGTASGKNNVVPPPLSLKKTKTTKTPMSIGSSVEPKRVISDEERCDDLFNYIRETYRSSDPKVLAQIIINKVDLITERKISDLFTTYIDNKEKTKKKLTENEENLKILRHELIATQSHRGKLTEANVPNREWQKTTTLGKINRRKSRKTRKRKPKKNKKKSAKRK